LSKAEAFSMRMRTYTASYTGQVLTPLAVNQIIIRKSRWAINSMKEKRVYLMQQK